ncbi:MAG: 4Fe-4S binding protein [Candidatus Adiutricales bacterium]
MGMITVDKDKCLKDGICSKVCVARIIQPADEDNFPGVDEQFEEHCLACGHCVAACPTGALDHRSAPKSDCLPWPEDMRFDPENIETLLRSRRAIRPNSDIYKDYPQGAGLQSLAQFKAIPRNLKVFRKCRLNRMKYLSRY